MKAVIISVFDWYDQRLKYVKNYLCTQGYETKIYLSDYNHITKTKNITLREDCTYVETIPYKKNLSIMRLISHYWFSIKIRKILRKELPDLIYVLFPPNSIAKECAHYKLMIKDCLLVFDVIDMWPESLAGKKSSIFPFKFWRQIRDKSLPIADLIFTECLLYQSSLNEFVLSKTHKLYLFRDAPHFNEKIVWDNNNIVLTYLGSINHITDIETISKVVFLLCGYFSNVTVNIIGGGESKNKFISKLKISNVIVVDYGIEFNRKKVMSILSRSHFGINMMKPDVYVGLTTKSIDYLQVGLPFLNTVKGDTYSLVEKYNCGFNISYNHINDITHRISKLSPTDYHELRKNSQKVFIEYFDYNAFKRDLEDGMNQIL